MASSSELIQNRDRYEQDAEIIVSKKRSYEAAAGYRGERVCVHNFASATNPAEYGEIVIFDSGVKGMVQDVRRDEIGCNLFGHDTEIREGTRVVRTGKRAGIPVLLCQ